MNLGSICAYSVQSQQNVENTRFDSSFSQRVYIFLAKISLSIRSVLTIDRVV